MLKAILFDFNGVIINDEPIHQKLIDEILLGENLRGSSVEEYQKFCLGRSDRACIRDILEHRGRIVSDEYLTKLVRNKAKLYGQYIEALETLPIYPDLEAFLQRIKETGIKIGLVTGALRNEAQLVLERAEIANYFSVIVAGDDIRVSKPQPDGYLLAVERFNRVDFNLQLQPQNCLAIEDTFAGIQAAKNAGMQVVGIAHTYPFHFMQRLANWAIDDFSQLDLERVKEVFLTLM
jgi:HAD superfamily hydrolase (TIGR01509 family)